MEEEVRGEIPTVRTGIAYKAGWTDEAVRCEVSVLEAAPDLLPEAPKKAQDFTFLLPADLKQAPCGRLL